MNNKSETRTMANNSFKANISLSDVSFQLESFEMLAFITVPTLQNYQFVASLNNMLEIGLCNRGVIDIVRKKQSFPSVIYSFMSHKMLFYMLLDIRGNNIDKSLKSFDKLLLISGDYNKSEPAILLENEFQLHLADTIDCRRFDLAAISRAEDKASESLLKLLVGDKNNEGLLFQVEMHLKDLLYYEEEEKKNDFFIY